MWANDFNADACATYRHNIGETHCGDVREQIVPDIENVDLLVAGFPCQSFSNAGSRKGVGDEKKGLLFEETFRFIDKLKPSAVFYENVRGILSSKMPDGTPVIEHIKHRLENDFGYHARYRLVNMSHFGIPTRRLRVVMIAIRDERYFPHVFPEIAPGHDLSIETILRGLTDDVPNQKEVMPLNPQAVRLGKLVPEGGSWKDIPYDDLPERWKKIRDNMEKYHYPKFYQRLDRTKVMTTITAAFKPENAAVWHPWEDRAFSVREICRLQSFPDDFVMLGKDVKSKYLQVGNSVPPKFAELLGRSLRPYLEGTPIENLPARRYGESCEFNVNQTLGEI